MKFFKKRRKTCSKADPGGFFGKSVNLVLSSIIAFGFTSFAATAANGEYLNFVLSSANQMNASLVNASQYHYQMSTTGGDPYIYTTPLTRANGYDNVVLTFEYTSNVDITDVQLFFGYPITEERSVKGLKIPASTTWSTCSFVLAKEIDSFGWGNVGDLIRFDLGEKAGVNFNIRYMNFRTYTDEEAQEVGKTRFEYLDFDLTTTHSMTMTLTDAATHAYSISTTANDPYVYSKPLTRARGSANVVLTFEYTLNRDIGDLQVFFAAPVTEARSIVTPISAASSWTTFSYVVASELESFNWGNVGDYIRFDPGGGSGNVMNIRNLHFRVFNDGEEDQAVNPSNLDTYLKRYLARTYPSSISNVVAGSDQITVTGVYNGSGSASLLEITPYQDILYVSDRIYTTPITSSNFTINLPRYVDRDGYTYDRTLSKWAIVEGTGKTLVSHAKYTDDIYIASSAAAPVIQNKKGLGGVFLNDLLVSDLDALDLKSVTINIPILFYMYSGPDSDRVAHTYGGKTYYFASTLDNSVGKMLRHCEDRGIAVSAIILINPTGNDPVIADILRHPDFTSSAVYSMPNMTNPESVNCYAAALDFLASRYNGQNGYGTIHHWILHNEIDIGYTWTNMGKKPLNTYMDTYLKSMRMCYNIARQHYAHSEVFISLTHSWTTESDATIGYKGRDMIDILNQYSKTENDFRWGLAQHPYALTGGSFYWNEPQPTFSYSTPFVTFKNLEVLDYWAKLPANKYRGSTMRSVWLSEAGVASESYEEYAQQVQSSGLAYAWKKIKALDGITAIQWHNWYDNPAEGVDLGLRKNPANNYDPKIVWYCYQAANTAGEDQFMAPYLGLIGIPNWNIIQPVTP